MKAILVHSPANTNLANNITTNLEKAGVNTTKDNRRLTHRAKSDKAIAKATNAAIILLITDNFLKDRECMYQAISFLKDPALKPRVYPIVGEGRYVDEEGNVSYTPTKFERVKNVIHYIDYWGEAFLHLRKQRRDNDAYKNDSDFNQKLEQVRAISSEIGEFLRILRSMEYSDFESLHEHKYQAFFRRKSWNQAQSNLLQKELEPFHKDATATPPVDINSIPGIPMVMDKAKEKEAVKEVKEEIKEEVEIPTEKETVSPPVEKPTLKEEELSSTPITNISEEKESGFITDISNELEEQQKAIQEAIKEVAEETQEEEEEITKIAEDSSHPVVPPKEEPEVDESIITLPQEEQDHTKVENVTPKVHEEVASSEWKQDDQKQDDLNYQNKSAYELLVSLFEEDEEEENNNNEVETETEMETETEKTVIDETSENLKETATPKIEDENLNPNWVNNIKEELSIINQEKEESPQEKEQEETDLWQESQMNKEGDIHATPNDELTEDPQAPKEEEETAVSQPETEELDLADIIATKENGDTSAALFMLKEALEKTPDHTAARYEYAQLLHNLDKTDETKYHLNVLLEHDPQHLDALVKLAHIYEQEGDYLNAKNCYQKALDIDEDNAPLQYTYAQLLNHNFKAQKKKAAKHYKKAYKLDDSNIDALYQYAVLLYEYKGKPKKALKKFKEVIAAEPKHPFANYDIAVLYYEMQEGQLAANYYRAAYLNNPELKTPKNDEAFRVDYYLRDASEEVVVDEWSIEDITELQEDYDISLLHENTSDDNIPLSELAKELGDVVHEDEEEDDENEEGEETEDSPQEVVLEQKAVQPPVAYQPNIPVAPLVVVDELVAPQSLLDELLMSSEEAEASIEAEANTEEETALQLTTETNIQPEPEADTSTIALITGATSGIGRATARLFAQKGHHLIITGRRAQRLESIKAELEAEFGVQVETLVFDVRSLNASRKAMDSLDPRFKDVDILVNNAGLAKGLSPIHEGDIDNWETMIDTNIKGLLYMSRLVSPGMVARGKGHIINIGSIAGKEVYPNGNVYCATKHAVDALTQAMRIDLHKYNIRVSSVCPGAVEETEFSRVRFDYDDAKAKDYQSFTPLNARDIAEIIYFVTTRPPHVNVQDVLVMATQQATATIADNTGRKW